MADDINPEEETSSEESFNYTADDAEYGIIRLFYSDSTDGWSVIGGDFTLPAPNFEYTADDAEYGIGYSGSSDTSFVWTTHNVAASADTKRQIAAFESTGIDTDRRLNRGAIADTSRKTGMDDAEYGIIRLFYSDSTDGWSVIGGDFTLPAPNFEYTADDAEYGIGYSGSSDTSFVWTTHNVAASADTKRQFPQSFPETAIGETKRRVAVSENTFVDTSRNIAVSEDVIAETKRKLAVSENINIDTVRHVVTTENIIAETKRKITRQETAVAETARRIKDIVLADTDRQIRHKSSEDIFADTKRKVVFTEIVIADTKRRLVGTIIADTNRQIGIFEDASVETSRRLVLSENIIADTVRRLASFTTAVADTDRRFSSIVSCDTRRRVQITEQSIADTQRKIFERAIAETSRILKEIADADTVRNVQHKSSETTLADTARHIVLSDCADADTSRRLKETTVVDTIRRIGVTEGANAETSRQLDIEENIIADTSRLLGSETSEDETTTSSSDILHIKLEQIKRFKEDYDRYLKKKYVAKKDLLDDEGIIKSEKLPAPLVGCINSTGDGVDFKFADGTVLFSIPRTTYEIIG